MDNASTETRENNLKQPGLLATKPDPREALATRLLSHGGVRVGRTPEPGGEETLVARGRVFDLPVKNRRVRQGQCHGNAAATWGRDVERRRLVTGYALSGDGIWRRHGWVIDGSRDLLVETTRRRECYFGAPLIGREAARFWHHNFPADRSGGLLDLACG